MKPDGTTSQDDVTGSEGATSTQVWTLRLYVAGDNRQSRAALSNLKRLCEQCIGEGNYEIEVIDLMKKPQLAKADQILAIPTLIRRVPEPIKRVIGSLSDTERAMVALDIRHIDPQSANRP
jgi:circadian clock protein KaiB